MHVAWHLPDGAPPAAVLQRKLAKRGVGVYSLDDAPVHVAEPLQQRESILLLGYPCLTEERIQVAVQEMARAVNAREPAMIAGSMR